MSVRFIHAADIHLGSPLRTVGAESKSLQDALRDATYVAFERIIETAIDEAVDFVVIAGDLYDQESRSVRANQFFVEQFERLDEAGIRCYLCYGNHDPLGNNAEMLDLPPNVHAFGHEDVECIEHTIDGAVEARILGQSYRTSAEARSMYHYYTPPDGSVPNIGVLHTGLDPDGAKYVPCSSADLEGKEDVHYWALGHIHHPRIHSDQPMIAYPGIPQSRDVAEPSVGGCYLVELDTVAAPTMEFVPTSPIVWLDWTVAMDDHEQELRNLSDLQATLEVAANEIQTANEMDFMPDLDVEMRLDGWSPKGYVCRWRLSGRSEIHEVIANGDDTTTFLTEQLRHELANDTPFVWTESVKDRTALPLPDIDELRENDPVLSEFFEIVGDLKDDPEHRDDMREKTGWVWYEPDDPEDERDQRLPLTDDRLDELIDRAEERVLDELIERREYVDS